ncbi:hypothetical protein FB565_003419 [Actinoplanes lutulentus]|uniref:HNH endonuclease signature motif containing protein n=1 Tax=Actinoplanes lutulentus TaxID=1287878 RepID=UPI0015ECCCD5|nr:HNH endonuclease signature motif containing protein [Actinoplanes lutulentus]MBB2943690.1 hypothetical protein [Actinoplanes lutulentus]
MREAVGKLREDVVAFATAHPAVAADEVAADCVAELHEAIQALTAVQLRLVRQLDRNGFAKATSSRGTAAWLRDRLRVDWHVARTMVEQATLLDQRPALDDALSAGEVSGAQVRVIGEALRFLPEEVGPETVSAAELALIEHAGRFEPARLRKLGDRILEHVAPGEATRLEGESLRRAEQRAWWRRGLTLCAPVSGSVRITGCLTVEDAAIVQAALEPLCAPASQRDRAGDSEDDSSSPRRRRADALVEVCRLALRSGTLPDHGGLPPQLSVTIDYEALLSGVGAASVDSGARLNAETARRMACDARILPVVLGGAGEPLDLGRARRLFTPAQRQALNVRDGGCAFPDCDRPPRWCESHHMLPWDQGGPTDVSQGVLLCRPHHRLVHGGGWAARKGPDGLPEFVPPPFVDPLRQPQRNVLRRPEVRLRT